MRILAIILGLLFAVPALGASLTTTWDEVTTDDTGQPLAGVVDEYRIYECSDLTVPIGVVDGTQVSYTEPDAIPSTGTYCRAVAAYMAPFEGMPIQGTLVVVMPGQPATINLQAMP